MELRPVIDVITGPMGSGKTTELLRRLERYSIAKRKTVLIKPKKDDRSGEFVGTHNSQRAAAIQFASLSSAIYHPKVLAAEVVGVDEGQFFSDLTAGCEQLANSGKVVIVAALCSDSEREKFVSVSELLPKCEGITKLTAICTECGCEASFTAHFGDKKEQIQVGGIGEYQPLCRVCHLKSSRSPRILPASSPGDSSS